MVSRSRVLISFFCLLSLVASALPGTALAQTTITSATNGTNITVSGDWLYDETASHTTDGIETLVFTNGNAQFAISVGTTDIQTSFAALGITQTVTDIAIDTTYALRGINAGGALFGVFQVVVGGYVQTMIAPVSSFDAALSNAQANIQIDGTPVMNGVDGTTLAGSIANSVGSGDATADATAPAILGDGAVAQTTESVVTETSATTSGPVAPTVADGQTGFIDANTWVSPQFGTIVTWDDNWAPYKDQDGKPEFSSQNESYYQADSMCLLPVDPEDQSSLCVDITTTNEWEVPWWKNPDESDHDLWAGTPHVAVVTSETAGSRANFDLNGNVWLDQREIGNGYVIRTSRSIPLSFTEMADYVAAAHDQVTVNGQPAYFLQQPEAFAAEMKSAEESIPSLLVERESILKDMGLITPTHYVSASMGCDATWNESLNLNQTQMNPIRSETTWLEDSDIQVATESFTLSATDYSWSFYVTCYSSVENLASLSNWSGVYDDVDVVRIDGVRATYLIDPSDYGKTITMAIKPIGTPTIEVYFTGPQEEIEGLQFGTLILGGVDIAEAIAEDGVIEKLP